MDATRVYFVGDRLWWAVAPFVAPIVGANTGEVAIAVFATSSPAVTPDDDRQGERHGTQAGMPGQDA